MSQPTKDTKWMRDMEPDHPVMATPITPPPALSLTISGPTDILRRVVVAGDDRMLGQKVKELALAELVRRGVADELSKNENKQFP